MRRMLCVVLLSAIMVSPAWADKQRLGDWIVDIQSRGTEAYTENDSGSAFGFLCIGETCIGYVDINTRCDNGAKFPLLVNSKVGSTYVVGTCVHWPKTGGIRYVVSMQDKDLVDAISTGSVIGFAIPLESGEFKVTRFSLRGALDATGKAVEAFKSQGRSGLRDSTL